MLKLDKKRYEMNLTIKNECIFKPIIYFNNISKSILYVYIIKQFCAYGTNENSIKFSIENCINNLDIDEKEKDIFPFYETLYQLQNRQIKHEYIKRGRITKLCFSLISYFKIQEGVVIIEVTEIIKEAINLLSDEDVQALDTFSLFKSNYSGLIYNYILNHSEDNQWILSLPKLRFYFNLKETQYKQYSDLRTIILDRVIEEINTFTQYNITLVREKKTNMITITWKTKS